MPNITGQIEVDVIRGFLLDGQPQTPGKRILVPTAIGLGVIASGKARRVDSGDEALAAAAAPESAQAPEAETAETRGRRRGGKAGAEEA